MPAAINIDLLSQMIGDLILERDEVALPGLGVFVAELMPASFSDRGYTVNPPYRRLSFRQRESDDRSLVEMYAKACGTGQADAERTLAEYLSGLREVLTTRKSVTFPGLGRLRATRENHFFFVPEETLDIYPAGFGLQPLSLKFRSGEDSAAAVSAAVARMETIVAPQGRQDSGAEPPAEPLGETASDTAADGADTPADVAVAADARKPRRRRMPLPLRLAAIAVVAAAVCLAALAVAGRVAPQAVDTILYTPAERALIWN